jgi:hypothetical protein
MDIGSNVFSDGMSYVALSRAKRLDRIFLVDFDYIKIHCDPFAHAEYNRLRKTINLPRLPPCNVRPNMTLDLPYKIIKGKKNPRQKKPKSVKERKARLKPESTARYLNIAGKDYGLEGSVKSVLQVVLQVHICEQKNLIFFLFTRCPS